jgi:tight adherence protein C
MTLPSLPLLDGRLGALVAVAVGLANFLTILAVIRALSPRDLMGARIRALADRRQELRSARLAPRRRPRERSMRVVRRLIGRLKLDRGKEARSVADQLAQAGFRSKDATAVFLAVRLAAPLVVGAAGFAIGPLLLPHAGSFARLITGLAGALAGAFLPSLLLKNQVLRRAEAIQKGLPDGLDLFVICAEAGLSLDSAMARVAREIGPGAPELADELGLTAIELGFLPNRRDALSNLGRRVALPSVRGLVNTLVQTERYGTPLAQALRILAAEFRDARMMKAEEKAARLPATLTVPLILFILPPLFVILLGPAIIQIIQAKLV